jgi:hypothetical protein
MSRALNLNLTVEEVRAALTKHGGVISSIEALRPAGTRVVLTRGEHAANLRQVLVGDLIDGKVTREPLRPGRR